MSNEQLRNPGSDASAGGSGLATSGSGGLARIRVRRFDPSGDAEAYYQEYDGIPYEGRSVLEVLHAIYEERDSTLAFRRLCVRGFCGSCFMVVNGVPALACQYPAQSEMVLEPHPKFPIIRDLVVDTEHPITDEAEVGARCAVPLPGPLER